MNKGQFRAIQAPFKDKYRRDPGAAMTTARASGRASRGMAFTVKTHGGPIEAGLHPGAGGDGTLALAEDMLLEALVACSGVTLQAVAAAFGVELRDARIVAEGDIDLRGTLAVSKDAPVGFREIRLLFELESDAPDETLEKLVSATDRYCVVLQTLRQPTEIRSTRVRLASTKPE